MKSLVEKGSRLSLLYLILRSDLNLLLHRTGIDRDSVECSGVIGSLPLNAHNLQMAGDPDNVT